VKKVFSTIRTKYITNKVLMDLTKGFRFYKVLRKSVVVSRAVENMKYS